VLVVAAIASFACERHSPSMPTAPPAARAATGLSRSDWPFCYVTDLSAWIPPVDERNAAYWSIPHMVKLTNRSASAQSDYLVVQPVVFDETVARKLGVWQQRGNHLYITWGDGFTAVTADVVPSGVAYIGRAQTFEDGNIGFHRQAEIKLTAVACPVGSP